MHDLLSNKNNRITSKRKSKIKTKKKSIDKVFFVIKILNQ